MVKSLKNSQSGFTVIELLVVIVVLALLSVLSINFYTSSQARGRDTNRVKDIGEIQLKLEEYANANNGGYPNTFTSATFPNMDIETLKDPSGKSITINAIVENKEAADKVANPTKDSAANYLYIPYGKADCTNNCSGYVLKTFVESPNNALSNPYRKDSLGKTN